METNLLKTDGRVCANSNCHHTESQHGDDCCWGVPVTIRNYASTPGCRCKGFVARRDTVRTQVTTSSEPAKPLDGDFNSLHEVKAGSANAIQADDRVATALERIAAALEMIDRKTPWPKLTPIFDPTPPWNPPLFTPPNMCGSPTKVT